jgi:hypothetical protein
MFDFSLFQNDCKSGLGRVVDSPNDLTAHRHNFSVQSCPNGQTILGTFPKTGRSRQEKCETKCAVRQTPAQAAACYVAGIEDFSSR